MIKGFVENVNIEDKVLILEDDTVINYDKLVIATGSKPNKFGWQGEDLKGVTGLYHKKI